MRNIIFIIMIVSFAMVSSQIRADEPLELPVQKTVSSPDSSIIAISDPVLSTTKIINNKTKKLLWQIPGWHRWLFVANDGKHVVTGYGGMNLIPRDYDKHMTLITFWRKGKKIKDVTLEEIVPNKSILQKTVSHYHWGGIQEIDGQGRLIVKRADQKVLYYDLDTGHQIN